MISGWSPDSSRSRGMCCEMRWRIPSTGGAQLFRRQHPFAFTPAFYADPQETVQLTAFVKKSKPDIPVGDLSAVIADIAVFLLPVIESLQSKASFYKEWMPEQGWSIRL